MFHSRRARCAVLLSFSSIFALSQPGCSAQSQSPIGVATGLVTGTVLDPSGARIPHATLTIHSDSLDRTASTDSEGHFSLSLPVGTYQLTVTARGFSASATAITVDASTPLRLSLPLAIAVRSEEVAVPIEDESAAPSNAGAIVFSGADLSSFSSDDATFQKEFLALAGSNGRPAEIYVNGLLATRVPPRQTIRQVSINTNPYSAAYDKIGFGRIDITTRPGGSALHGQLQLSGNDSALNARNPYAPTQPANDTFDILGNINGPLGRKSSFFLYADDTLQNFNATINAYTLGANPQPLSEAVAAPQRHLQWDTRADRQFSASNTFTAHYVFDQASQQNGGLTGQVLPEAAYNSGTTTQTLQLLDSQVLGPRFASESRLQYMRTRLNQNPLSSAPSILIEGLTTGGGNAQQSLHDNQDTLELQQLFSADQGRHFIQFGARYRLQRDANLSTAFYNGQYIFPSLAAYQAAQPTQLTLAAGRSSATIVTSTAAAFMQDDWHVAKTLSLEPGLRVEAQSAIPDHLDIAPRLGFAWSPDHKGKPLLNLRGGAGIFYDRFDAANLLTSVRQNGTTQQTYLVTTSIQYPNVPPASSLSAQPPTTYTVSPNLRSELYYIAGISADRTFRRRLRIGATYLFTDGSHQWLSQDINAPLPGSGGLRPLGTPQNVYQFTSNGHQVVHTLDITTRYRASARLYFWTDFNLQFNRTNTLGPTSFLSNPYNLQQDFGRYNGPLASFFGGATVQLPLQLSADAYLATLAGTPFNITTGTDLNGDGIYNDRPAYATAPTANSVLYPTPYGTLDANPQPGEPIIPINAGNSPGFIYLQTALHRAFAIGPRPEARPGAKSSSARPWSLTFSVEAANLLNHNNPSPPIGVLNSPYFGQSITLNAPFATNPSANRTITLRAAFSF
ncbi:hypothetical protein GOB94_06825 [Granulicella sp. 5B5]|uniref:TonB-dependent receptor n=1 Tax=Granulicella sp. 5B5 TaxID=1617967 RepID=UPI0015F35D11|nr:carboxypeptidase regulatory-like domain-containing protein [Granulicella sp. 5B5]QMV18429.1 hypothetical protein GOB94_06825 [Granulicella sp. 5B5]